MSSLAQYWVMGQGKSAWGEGHTELTCQRHGYENQLRYQLESRSGRQMHACLK